MFHGRVTARLGSGISDSKGTLGFSLCKPEDDLAEWPPLLVDKDGRLASLLS